MRTNDMTRCSIFRSPFFGCWALTLVLLAAGRTAHAKPQIEIKCGSVTNNQLPFYLYWNIYNSGESSWENYVSIDLYDSTGNQVSTYPQDITSSTSPDPTTQSVSASSTPSGQPSVAAAPGGTAVINVTGEWNTNSCTQAITRKLYYCCRGVLVEQSIYDASYQCCLRSQGQAADPYVWAGDPVPVNGQSRQFDIPLYIVYSTPSGVAENWRFTYALIKRTTATSAITPLTESGRRFLPVRQNHNGGGSPQAQYQVTSAATDAAPFLASDLRIRLSGQDNPPGTSDYVYLDIFAVNLKDINPQTQKASYALIRIPIQIPENP